MRPEYPHISHLPPLYSTSIARTFLRRFATAFFEILHAIGVCAAVWHIYDYMPEVYRTATRSTAELPRNKKSKVLSYIEIQQQL